MGLISFQGEYGANSHLACQNLYPHMEVLPCASFHQALEAVKEDKAELAMIPIENSLAGRVADIHHLLPLSNLFIIEEYFLPIHFHLMTLNTTKIEEITTIYSHVHALGQCRKLITKNNWQAVEVYDTAGAAKLLQQQQTPNIAVLAPKLAASIYNLKILAENVEDEDFNITRFVILSKHKKIPALKADQKMITTLLFQTKNVPSALYKALGGFATNGVNITKLESYQLADSFRATQFLADIEGHIDDFMVKLALEELAFFSKTFQILGVYPAKSDRKS